MDIKTVNYQTTFNFIKAFLINRIKEHFPKLKKIDNDTINCVLYTLIYTIKKDKDNIDKYFNQYTGFTSSELIDKIYANAIIVKKSKNKTKNENNINIDHNSNLLNYFIDAYLIEKKKLRYIYLFLLNAKCNTKNLEPGECIALIPKSYKDKYDNPIDILRNYKKIEYDERVTNYLFVDYDKFRSYNVDTQYIEDKIVYVDCNVSPYFKLMCNKDLLIKGSNRPLLGEEYFFPSARCLCWPEK